MEQKQRRMLVNYSRLDSAGSRASFAVATGFWSGLSPVAPGTAGSAAALVIPLALASAGAWNEITTPLLLCATFFIVGVVTVELLLRRGVFGEGVTDPQRVVVDEFVGMYATMFYVPVTGPNLLIAFLLFRVFDVTKPFPIRKVEHVHGAYGVILDDLVAGIYACIAFHVIRQYIPI